jgi:hypothetical protein
MLRRTLEASDSPAITITECSGDLLVRGSETRRITLRVNNGADELQIKEEGNVLSFAAQGDCIVGCPPGSSLNVHSVHGDVKIRGVRGQVKLDSVHGDVVLRGVGSTVLGAIAGDVNARDVGGDLRAASIAADARVRGVAGSVTLEKTGGDLKADGLEGGLIASQVGADVRLGPPFVPGTAYRVHAGGGLRLSVPADANLHLTLRAGGRVRSRVPDLILEEGDGEITGVLGDGEATLEAEVGGTVRVRLSEEDDEVTTGFGPDLEGLGAYIEAQIADTMANVGARVDETLSRIDHVGLQRRAEREAEHAVREAERRVVREGRAAEQARLRAERAERRWRRASGRPERSERQPVSDEERLHVLRLLEVGKISPEQAADLLSALDGN